MVPCSLLHTEANLHLIAADGRREVGPFGGMESLRRVFREDDQIEAGITAFHAFDEAGDAFAIVEHLRLGLDHRNFVIDDRDADSVITG